MLQFSGQPDEQFQVKRSGDLLGEEAPDTASVDPPHQLAAQPPVGERVIAAGGAGVGELALAGEQVGHPPVVEQVAVADGDRHTRQPGGVRHDLLHGYRRFAPRCELRPVTMDRRVELKLTSVDQHQQADRDQTLGAGEDQRQSVGIPGSLPVTIGQSAPEVDHQLTVPDRGKRGPQLTTLREVARKLTRHGLVAAGDEPADLGDVRHRPPSSPALMGQDHLQLPRSVYALYALKLDVRGRRGS